MTEPRKRSGRRLGPSSVRISVCEGCGQPSYMPCTEKGSIARSMGSGYPVPGNSNGHRIPYVTVFYDRREL